MTDPRRKTVEPTCEAWFVVSIDEAQVPRVIYKDPDETTCHPVADNYWADQAVDGEEVMVTCEHDDLTHAALGHSVE